jgi:hypothetical protein
VETFNETIGLGMIGSGGLVVNIEERAKVGPEGGSKLRATVRSNNSRKTKAGNPGGEEGGGAVGGGSRGKWDNFRPSGGAVNDGEEVSETVGRRKWANEVNMNVGKFLWWDRNVLWDSVSVVMNLGALAGGTLAGPVGNLCGHTMPDETGSDEAFSGADSRVG